MKTANKVYVPIRIQTNALTNEDTAVSGTYVSFDDLLTNATKETFKDVEVRYLDNLRSYRKKFMPSYSCDKDHCSAVKTRFIQHQMAHHQIKHENNRDSNLQTCSYSHSQTVTPTTSILQLNPNLQATESKSMPTISKFVDVENGTTAYLRNNYLTDDLKNEIKKLSKDLTIYPKETKSLHVKLNNENQAVKCKDDNDEDTFKIERDKELIDACNKSNFEKILLDVIRKSLKGVSNDCRNNVKERVADILTECLESVHSEKDKDKLRSNAVRNTIKISKTKPFDVKIQSVREILTRDVMGNEDKSSCHSSTMSIVTLEPKLQRNNIRKDLNVKYTKNEIDFLNKIKSLIGNWIDTLPKSNLYDDKKHFTEMMIEDLAIDILDQLKTEQFTSKVNTHGDKFIVYIVYRWLFYFEIYNDLNNAYPKIYDLVKRLHEIPTDCLTALQEDKNNSLLKELDDDCTPTEDASKTNPIMKEGFASKSQNGIKEKIITLKSDEFLGRIYAKSNEKYLDQLMAKVTESMPYRINDKQKKEIHNDIAIWVNKILKQLGNPNKITNSSSHDKCSKNTVNAIGFGCSEDDKTSDSNISQKGKKKQNVVKSNFQLNSRSRDTKYSRSSKSPVLERIQKNKYLKNKNFELTSGVKTFKPGTSEVLKVTQKIQENRQNGNEILIETKAKGSKIPQDVKKRKNLTQIRKYNDEKKGNFSESETSQNELITENMAQRTQRNINEVLDTKNSLLDMSQNLQNKCVNFNKPVENLSSNCIYDCQSDTKDIEAWGEKKKVDKRLGNTALNHFLFTCKDCVPLGSKGSHILRSTTPVDADKTLMELIGKYIEHKYDIVHSIIEDVFDEILTRKFQELYSTSNEVNDIFTNSDKHDVFFRERLAKELQYVKYISDWLKNIPIDGSFNTLQNKKRIAFVNNLAKKISDLEENGHIEPAIRNNVELVKTINDFSKQLPILPEQISNVPLMVDQLVAKVVSSRNAVPWDRNALRSSLNNTGIQEQSIGEFIDNFIRFNAGEIAEDPVKLEAWSARVLEEAKKILRGRSGHSTRNKTELLSKLSNEDESIRIFDLELDYAKEIFDWLNNLPLLPITTPEATKQRVEMIIDLAEKFAEREENGPTGQNSETDIKEYISKWINEIPIMPNRDIIIPIVIQQLLNRIEKVNKGSLEIPLETSINPAITTSKKFKTKPQSKSKKNKEKIKGGQLVVDIIEKWSNDLPVAVQNKDTERNIKNEIARNLYRTVGDLSIDPKLKNDDTVYKILLEEEISQQLNLLPETSDIQKKKESLKNDLVEQVMTAKNIANESIAGDHYKHQLENTLDTSLPNPITQRQVYDPGFEIYKNRLTDMFVLENYDHGNINGKLKYEKVIKKDIDKFSIDAQKRNAIPLSKVQIYNELYSALYNVPFESAIDNEVENIKTRCEITEWFENLPLQEASDNEEVLKRSQIISTLAKRLREIEKDQTSDEKMLKEITKWLLRLPIIPKNDEIIDKYAKQLQNQLKSTKEDRLYVPSSEVNSNNNENNKKRKNTSKTKGVLGTSQIAGPSSAGQMWSSPQQPQSVSTPKRKAGEIILEIVKNWCSGLPFTEKPSKSYDSNDALKEELATKLIIKICELNDDPQTFSDDILYNYFLDQELHKLMENLPLNFDSELSEEYKKAELVDAINSLKPLIREERARHKYKKELNATVNNILHEPLNSTSDKIALFEELREGIIENFVQFHYNHDDYEAKQAYKEKLRDAILKYFMEIQEDTEESPVDPLVRQNQLICELEKIPIPNMRILQEEVEEIKMRNEVEQFFQSIPVDSKNVVNNTNNVKLGLAKRLNEIEKTGHNNTNDTKMSKVIARHLKKLDKEVSAEKIQSFIEVLKATEPNRKAKPTHDAFFGPRGSDQPSVPNNNSRHYDNYQYPDIVVNSPSPITEWTSRQHLQNRLLPPNRDYVYESSNLLGIPPNGYQTFGQNAVASSSPQEYSQRLGKLSNTYNPPFDTDPANLGENATERKRRILDEEECKCLAKRGRWKMKGQPQCMLRRVQFCEDCGNMRMAMNPRCYY